MLVKQSHEIWEQDFQGDLSEGMRKHIERVGRVCYRSEDRITEDSAQNFVTRLIVSQHFAMLEHGTVYLTIPCRDYYDYGEFLATYGRNPYTQYDDSECNWSGRTGNIYVTTNYRVLLENNWLQDVVECITAPTEKHPKRVTVHFVTNRQIANELVRHRTMSFAQESTRYCNYTKEKFFGQLSFIAPCWLEENPNEPKLHIEDPVFLESTKRYMDVLDHIGYAYDQLVRNCHWSPQQAANILPNALKTELVVTGFVSDWKHIFRLRTYIAKTGKPHPQMEELMNKVLESFIKMGYIPKDFS